MDYVVYGTGYGATLMLLGYAIRTWGPNWRFRDEDERAYARGELRSARSAWTRFTGGLGAVVATCGVILILFTFALMLANPGDDISEIVSLVLSGLLLVAVAVWAWMYVERFGTFGVVRAPAALSGQAAEPLRYDNRQQQQPAAASPPEEDAHADDEAGEVVDEDVFEGGEDEESVEIDEDDAAELEARYSKFESHHPDLSDEASEPEAAADDDVSEETETTSEDTESGSESTEPGSDEVEARASRFETHHPEMDDAPSSSEDEATEVIAEELAEAPVADEAPADDPVETIDVAEVAVEETMVLPAVEHDELPVAEVEQPKPEADAEPAPAPRPEASDPAGGPEDALRRLRERQASRARRADDA